MRARRLSIASLLAPILVLALAGPVLAGGGGGISCGLPPEEFGKCIASIVSQNEVRIRQLGDGSLLGAQFTLAPLPSFGTSPTVPFPTVVDPAFSPLGVSGVGVTGDSFTTNTPVFALVGSIPTLVTGDAGFAWVFGDFNDVGDQFTFRFDADPVGVGGITHLFPGMDVTLDLGLGAGNPVLTFPAAAFGGFGTGDYRVTLEAAGFAVDVCGGTMFILQDGTRTFSCGLAFEVPLAPALALLGVGAVAFAALRRRRA